VFIPRQSSFQIASRSMPLTTANNTPTIWLSVSCRGLRIRSGPDEGRPYMVRRPKTLGGDLACLRHAVAITGGELL